MNLLGHRYDYRLTVAPWFRGLFSGSPANRPAESGTSGRRWRRIGVPY